MRRSEYYLLPNYVGPLHLGSQYKKSNINRSLVTNSELCLPKKKKILSYEVQVL